MIRDAIDRLREWVAVEDPDERIEGSGKAITSPQHRRSPASERELERLEDVAGEHRDEELSVDYERLPAVPLPVEL
jgi:hypothetical protein